MSWDDGIPFGLPPITEEAALRIALGMRDDELERRDNYIPYLASDLWRRTRELALEYYGSACCLCNSPDDLNVHHRTYERVGRERLVDLIVLCRDCHAVYHREAA